MQARYARRIMRYCFIRTVRSTPVLRRTSYMKWIMQRPIHFLTLVETAFAAQFLYYVQAFTVFLSFFSMKQSPWKAKSSWTKYSPCFMELDGLLLHPQKPITCRCANRDQSSPTPAQTTTLSFHLYFGFPRCLFNSDFPTNILYVPLLSPTRDKNPPIFFLIWPSG